MDSNYASTISVSISDKHKSWQSRTTFYGDARSPDWIQFKWKVDNLVYFDLFPSLDIDLNDIEYREYLGMIVTERPASFWQFTEDYLANESTENILKRRETIVHMAEKDFFLNKFIWKPVKPFSAA